MTRASKAAEIRSQNLTSQQRKINTRPASYRSRREQQPWIEIFAICEFFHWARGVSEISSFVLTVCGGSEERKVPRSASTLRIKRSVSNVSIFYFKNVQTTNIYYFKVSKITGRSKYINVFYFDDTSNVIAYFKLKTYCKFVCWFFNKILLS